MSPSKSGYLLHIVPRINRTEKIKSAIYPWDCLQGLSVFPYKKLFIKVSNLKKLDIIIGKLMIKVRNLKVNIFSF